MKIKSVKMICFSPTGTTRAVIQRIAYGIGHENIEMIDITRPGDRERQLYAYEDELLIIAVPVYMGRVPALLNGWLNSVKASNTPVVCVVVYGNRVFDNALLELKDILIKRGCIPVAAAACIGEHSFSSPDTPIAEGRPDAYDLNHAESFGREIKEKLLSLKSLDQNLDINIPGSYPYGGVTNLWSVDFIAISSECNQCGICAEECPVGAINSEKSNLIDIEKCITCCACIKNCPQKARTMKPSVVKDAAMRLNKLYKERKEPVFFC